MDSKEKEFWNESYQAVIRLDAEANETRRNLSAQLITFSTLMVTLTAFFLGQKDIELNAYQKGFLTAGLVILLFSIGFGIAEYFIVDRFFKKSALKYIEMLNSAPKNPSLVALHKHRSEKLKGLPIESSNLMMYGQVGSICLGVILYLVLILTILW